MGNPSPDAHPESNMAETVPPSVYLCFMILGLTTGLYIGLSESPVVGTFVTGVLTVVVGGALAALIGKSETPSIPRDRIGELARCVILFCTLSIAASLGGIALRNNVLPALLTTPDAKKPHLVDITQKAQSMPQDKILKLVLLQTSLSNLDVAPQINNQIIDAQINAIEKGKVSYAFGTGGQVDQLQNYINASRSLVESFLVEAPTGDLWRAKDEIDKIIADYKITDEERLKNLRIVGEFLETNERIHAELLQLVRRDAGEAEVALHELRQPELDTMVQLVLTYGNSVAGLQPKKRPIEKKEIGLSH